MFTNNEEFNRHTNNSEKAMTSLTSKSHKRTLNSANGLVALQCSALVSFFVDASRKKDSFKERWMHTKDVLQKTDRRSCNSVSVQDAAVHCLANMATDDVRKTSTQLGLDTVFYAAMAISHSRTNESRGHAVPKDNKCPTLRDSTIDERNILVGRCRSMQGVDFKASAERQELGSIGMNMAKELESIANNLFDLVDRCVTIPDEVRHDWASKNRAHLENLTKGFKIGVDVETKASIDWVDADEEERVKRAEELMNTSVGASSREDEDEEEEGETHSNDDGDASPVSGVEDEDEEQEEEVGSKECKDSSEEDEDGEDGDEGEFLDECSESDSKGTHDPSVDGSSNEGPDDLSHVSNVSEVSGANVAQHGLSLDSKQWSKCE